MPNPNDVNHKLRKVDTRISRIDRKLGFLQTRLYFQPMDGGWEEVPILQATDLGSTPKNFKTGEEVYAHRYTVRVGRNWLDARTGITGDWAIAPDGIEANKQRCELENQSVKDNSTFGTLDFRIAQTVNVNLPPIPPTIIPPPFPG
jgi:hypothetical protein